MSDIEAKLRISADTVQALRKVGELHKQIAGLTDAGKGAAPLADASTLRPVSDQLATIRSQAMSIRGLLSSAFAAVGLGGGLAALTRYADGYAGLTARLRIATEGQQQFNQALDAARSLGSQYQQGLQGVARLIDKTYSAIKPLGGTLADATGTTEALLAALTRSGATAEESASGVLQFAQALASGVLQGDEFRSLAEAAPAFLDALAEGLGKPRSELKALGEQGKLTSDQIVIGLARALPKLRETAAAIPPTIGGGFTVLNNAISEFVGRAAQTSGVARAIADVLKLAADNAGVLVTAFGALAGAAVLVGLGSLASALAGVVTVTIAAGGAMSALLALIGGPVGLVVALGALAAGWGAVSTAKQRALDSDLGAMQRERAQIQAELDKQRAEIGKSVFSYAPIEARRLEEQLALLDAKIAELERKKRVAEFEALRRGEKADFGGPNIRDEAGLKRLSDEYKTAAEINRKFEADRQQLVKASQEKIAFLRESGREQDAADLEAETAARLKVIDKAQADALRKEAPVASRVAAFKASFDATLELQRDAIAREQKLNQQRYDDALQDARTYLAERARLEDQAAADDLQRLGSELAERRRTLAQNESRLALAQNPNERETIGEALFAQKQEIAKLEVDIAKRTRDQADAEAARLRDARLLTAELAQQQRSVGADLAEARGERLSEAQLRARRTDALAPQFDRARQLGANAQPLLDLVQVQVTRDLLAQVRDDFQRAQQAIALAERAITDEVAAGHLTTAEGEARVLALRAEQIPVLDAIIERMRELAQTKDERAAIDALQVQVKGMSDLRTELEKTARSEGVRAITTALDDIATGAKTGKEALLDMVSSFARTMLNVLNAQLAEKLVQQFADAAGGGSGGKSWFDAASAIALKVVGLFHSGGVVGAGGGATRAVNPAVFTLAPRYHGGGIAGLLPGERPAILMDGEEVLTARDPRHVRNYRGAASGNQVFVEINGAQGSPAQQQAGGADLGRMVLAVVEQWAAKESRTGGLLAGAGR